MAEARSNEKKDFTIIAKVVLLPLLVASSRKQHAIVGVRHG
jgi:hypothetical protein